MFGAPVPGINMQGKTEHQTVLGTLISIFIISVTIFYALFKLQHMLLRKAPQISILVEDEGVPFDEKLNIA